MAFYRNMLVKLQALEWSTRTVLNIGSFDPSILVLELYAHSPRIRPVFGMYLLRLKYNIQSQPRGGLQYRPRERILDSPVLSHSPALVSSFRCIEVYRVYAVPVFRFCRIILWLWGSLSLGRRGDI